jgi:hypothetical protein
MQWGLCTERAVHWVCTDGAVFKEAEPNEAVLDMLKSFAGVSGNWYPPAEIRLLSQSLFCCPTNLPTLKGPLPEYPTTSAARQGVHFTDP